MNPWPVAAALALLCAGCVSHQVHPTAASASGMKPFDAQVLRALRNQNLANFTASLPATDEPDKKLVDARYGVSSTSAAQGDPASYTVLIHRASRQIWIQKTGPDGVDTFGPAAMNNPNP